MKIFGIIAEFNPFHNGHEYLIDHCKKNLGADYVIVVMSGDYVQRGAPALVSKFTRAKMALLSGADLVLELPLYYSLGSAEYFAQGAISVLSGLGVVTDLVFGCEADDLDKLGKIADILANEPPAYCAALKKALSEGLSYPSARAACVKECLSKEADENLLSKYTEILASPNCALAIEYLKALSKRASSITPHAVKRVGASYESSVFDSSESVSPSSAKGIRKIIGNMSLADIAKSERVISQLEKSIPKEALAALLSSTGQIVLPDQFSDILFYKLFLEKEDGYMKYLDVSEDFSNRIASMPYHFERLSDLCNAVKTKNLTYTRISRSLMHIILNITAENMAEYKDDGFTAYGRILGMKKDASTLLSAIDENGDMPVPGRLKEAKKLFSPLQLRLFNETHVASLIYDHIAGNGITSELRLPLLIV